MSLFRAGRENNHDERSSTYVSERNVAVVKIQVEADAG